MGTGSKCSGCSLAKSGSGFTQTEIGAQYQRNRLLIVGSVAEEADVREGLPLRPYSRSGSLFTDSLRAVALSRSDIAITQLIRCRPVKDWFWGSPFQYSAINHCEREYLIDTVRELKPTCILAMGDGAFRALAKVPSGRWGQLPAIRGYVLNGAGAADGIPVVGTFDPGIIRGGSAELTGLFQRDLRRAFNVAIGKFKDGEQFSLDPMGLGLRYQTAPTLKEAWDYANSINPDLPLALDIETPYSTRSDEDERTSFTDRDIKLFQCTQQRGSGIAIPFREEYISAIKHILLHCPRKVGFNNWNFDDPVLAANGIDVGITDDAMVMFHTFQPDLPANLQAAAQYCGFQFPWKSTAEIDLEWYGCADVDATLCVYYAMRRVLEETHI